MLLNRSLLGTRNTARYHRRLRFLPCRYQTTSTTTPSSPTRPCSNCKTPLLLLTTPCPNCSTLLPLPNNLSFYSLLNLSQPVASSSPSPSSSSSSSTTSSPASARIDLDIPAELSLLPQNGFTLNPRSLRQNMLQRQKELHPDKFVSQGESVVGLAKELSGRVNDAFGVLVDPLRRAEYILSVHDLATEETDSLTDPGLLMEVMDAREELENAQGQEEVDELRRLNHDGAEKVQATISQITEAFSESPPNLAGVKVLSVQLKYWMGLEEAAKEWSAPVLL